MGFAPPPRCSDNDMWCLVEEVQISPAQSAASSKPTLLGMKSRCFRENGETQSKRIKIFCLLHMIAFERGAPRGGLILLCLRGGLGLGIG